MYLPVLIFLSLLMAAPSIVGIAGTNSHPRAREIGIQIGVLRPGKWNAITDVHGVKVGHATVIQSSDIRTGVTAVLPHGGNVFARKVPAAIFVGNGFGKLAGVTQVDELGNIETPILLTNTLNVPKVADALIDYMLSVEGNSAIRSINPVVGETNDAWLNNIQARAVTREHVVSAITNSTTGPVDEGCVGAGTGTLCLGFKGGIGTSSRVLPESAGGYTVGILVQTNFGGILEVNGAPVGRELGRYSGKDQLKYEDGDGSCMIVVATDAPLSSRNLKRLAKRAYLALAKVGAYSSNGSGDYVIAFSNYPDNLIAHEAASATRKAELLRNEKLSPLFLAAVEATQEAILNSILKATPMTGRDGHQMDAIAIDSLIAICKKYNALNWADRFGGL